MDFNLSKEQQDIQRAAREFAQGEFPDRALEFDREEKFDLSLWKKAVLPKLVAGEAMIGTAITEPDAASVWGSSRLFSGHRV